jgi:hypothetical protein
MLFLIDILLMLLCLPNRQSPLMTHHPRSVQPTFLLDPRFFLGHGVSRVMACFFENLPPTPPTF